MRATVYSGKDKRLGMQRVTVKLAAIGQLKDTLTNLKRGTVNLVKKQNTPIIATILKPIRRIKLGAITVNRRQTNQITLGHLGCPTLNHTHTLCSGKAIHSLALTDTVTTANKDRLLDVSDKGDNTEESLEINGHCEPRLCYTAWVVNCD
jgi:hypothetical protein